MSGTAKWLMVSSVVVLAVVAVIALGLFAWMLFNSPMMGATISGWGMPHMSGTASGWTGARSGSGGMMGAMYGYGGFSGQFGPGMMGGPAFGEAGSNEPGAEQALTVAEVETRLEQYLAGREDLVIAEIMIFDNHAYAEIRETETGIGAMELLVFPVTLAVSPEPGPNMMWNQKYGGMHGGGMMGSLLADSDPAEMTVTPQEAVDIAQAYLDLNLPGLVADEHADPFYGYYTIHTSSQGKVVGMLSVNGTSGAVFLHTWHGNLLEMTETDPD